MPIMACTDILAKLLYIPELNIKKKLDKPSRASYRNFY